MKKVLITSILYTAITAVLLGIGYPVAITAIAHVAFPQQARGELITRGDEILGSRLIGQPFTGSGFFHSRPSAAGTGYDAQTSSGSNYGPSSQALMDRVKASVASDGTGAPIPVDLVTASASGLDPDISPAAAKYQSARVARERHMPEEAVADLVRNHTKNRQFGLLGEPRVNVLELNLALQDAAKGR